MGLNSDPNAGGLFTFTPDGSSPSRPEYVRAYCGDEGLILPFAEGAGQSFSRGDLVKLSSGAIIACTYTATALDDDQIPVGFAQEGASGTTGTRIRVRVIRPDDVFLMNMDSDDTYVTANAGAVFGLKRPSAGVYVVDSDDATNADVMVLASNEFKSPGSGLNNVLPNSAGAKLNATAAGRVYVKFLESQIRFSAVEAI
jgi:hypothetical protein